MHNNRDNTEEFSHLAFNFKPKKRKIVHLSVGFLKLQFLFDIEKFSTKLVIIGFISVFIGVYNFFLLERTGLYSLGINSVFQAIARCTSYFLNKNSYEATSNTIYPILFWGMSLLFNLPMAILGYVAVGSRFAILSVFSLAVSTVVSIILSSLPESWGLKDFYIFSDPRTFNGCLISKKINILQWNYLSVFKSSTTGSSDHIALNDSSNVALIFLYGLVFGACNTFTTVVIYALGASTGGMDWIVFYLSKKKMHSMNNLFLYLGLSITFISYLIGTYVPYVDHMSDPSHKCSSNVNNGVDTTQFQMSHKTINDTRQLVVSTFFGPVLIATFLSVIAKRLYFSFFYPHFKLINVRIFTNRCLELRRILQQSNFPHSFTISTAIGGYKLREQTVLEITCFALELKTLKEHTRKIDPDCLIFSTPIKSLSGKFSVRDNLN